MGDVTRRALITGGRGALGSRLAQALAASGWDVRAPEHRELDVERPGAMGEALDAWRPDIVVNCAAWTDVAGAERFGSGADSPVWSVNAWAPGTVARACASRGVACLHVSSDYVVEGLPTPVEPGPAHLDGPGRAYAVTKAEGEGAALAAGASVARVSTLDPDKAATYRWLNGYTRASREWAEDCARRLALFLDTWRPEQSRIWHLAPPGRDTTVADLVRARFPEHPALADVVTDPEEFARRAGYRAPLDVRLGGCPALLPGEVAS